MSEMGINDGRVNDFIQEAEKEAKARGITKPWFDRSGNTHKILQEQRGETPLTHLILEKLARKTLKDGEQYLQVLQHLNKEDIQQLSSLIQKGIVVRGRVAVKEGKLIKDADMTHTITKADMQAAIFFAKDPAKKAALARAYLSAEDAQIAAAHKAAAEHKQIRETKIAAQIAAKEKTSDKKIRDTKIVDWLKDIPQKEHMNVLKAIMTRAAALEGSDLTTFVKNNYDFLERPLFQDFQKGVRGDSAEKKLLNMIIAKDEVKARLLGTIIADALKLDIAERQMKLLKSIMEDIGTLNKEDQDQVLRNNYTFVNHALFGTLPNEVQQQFRAIAEDEAKYHPKEPSQPASQQPPAPAAPQGSPAAPPISSPAQPPVAAPADAPQRSSGDSLRVSLGSSHPSLSPPPSPLLADSSQPPEAVQAILEEEPAAGPLTEEEQASVNAVMSEDGSTHTQAQELTPPAAAPAASPQPSAERTHEDILLEDVDEERDLDDVSPERAAEMREQAHRLEQEPDDEHV